MSLILDALNRSRHDADAVPGLESQHALPDSGRSGNNLWWALALVAALAVIAFLLYERGAGGEPPAPPQPAAVEQQAQAVEPGPTVEAQPAVVATEPVPVEVQPRRDPPAIAPEPVSQVANPGVANPDVAALYQRESAPETPKPAVNPEAVQPEKGPETAPVTTESEQPVDLEAMLQQARDELENAQLEEHPVPFLATLSQQTKDGIPTIFYERHDYSGRAGQSSVVLNGRTLKAGGTTSEGVRVDEILPDSVVLQYQGTQFRLRALNSWVNL